MENVDGALSKGVEKEGNGAEEGEPSVGETPYALKRSEAGWHLPC